MSNSGSSYGGGNRDWAEINGKRSIFECFRCHYGFTKDEWSAVTICPQCGLSFNKRAPKGSREFSDGKRSKATGSAMLWGKQFFGSVNRYPLVAAGVLWLAGWLATATAPFLLSAGRYVGYFGMILAGVSVFVIPAVLCLRYLRSFMWVVKKGFKCAFGFVLGGIGMYGLGYLMIYMSFTLYILAVVYAVLGIIKLLRYGVPKVVEVFKSVWDRGGSRVAA